MKPFYQSFTLFLVGILFLAVSARAQSNTCAGATLLPSDSVCTNVSGTLSGATADGGAIATSCGTAINSEDVWYRFVPKTQFPSITVSGLGSSWGTRLKIQLLSGSCGSFTQVACADHAGASTTVTPALTSPLTPGTTYYIRIYKNSIALPTGANWGFNICITNPLSKGGRMGEVFSRTVLSPAGVLNYPWEIAYGQDNFLWITESKGYRVYRMNPTTGTRSTVLDISQGSAFLPATFRCQFNNGAGAQGGLAGLALHPNFMDGTANEKNFVYISYIYSSNGGSSPSGIFFTNRLVRFTYNVGLNVLESPVLIATLPGSSDHNSQRIAIASVTIGGPKFLFYASGDMGSGQFGNRTRPMNAQNQTNVEGKILRFNLDTVGGVPWIPTTNPFSSTSSVWSNGIRNNQGFAYDSTLNILYGASHGAYSDDEINIIEPRKNYGHPLVIGYADGNYNGNVNPGTSTSISAGAPWTDNSGSSTCPPIGSETTRMNAINAAAATSGAYKGPLFSAYATPAATVANTWLTNPGNAGWLSEGWSGLDIYQSKIIPGWHKSLVAAGLKWGRLIRLKLGTNGTTTLPSGLDSANTSDTVTYFQSTNRYRDLAFAPNGKDVFLVMDNNSATSGPGVGNPVVPACPGCVIKYSFLGYAETGGLSAIPESVNVTEGTVNTCNPGTTVTIDGSNNYLWVPITGPDGNIMAEINAMGQSLGVVTSSFYKKAPLPGSIRSANGTRYLDRNITITPTVTSFATPVKVRLYFTKAELDSLIADPASFVTSISDIKILKNNDPCVAALGSSTTEFVPTNTTLADKQHGANGYVLQTEVSSFSSFYFAASNITLPITLVTLNGKYLNNSIGLNWKTASETNSSHFVIERSNDATAFSSVGTVAATGNSSNPLNYSFKDYDVLNKSVNSFFYRLKMVDIDGSYKYSNVINIALPGTSNMITLSPNPAVKEMKASISSSADCNADWQIIDAAGRVLMQNTALLQ